MAKRAGGRRNRSDCAGRGPGGAVA
jgi:hypothetical protein